MKYKIPVGIGDFVIDGKYSWISVMLPGNCNLCSPNRSAGSLLTTTSSQVPPHHVWQQQLSHEEDHGISRISWPQGKVWSWVWHFLYEMLICISFRFIKAIWKYVREKKKEKLYLFFVLLILNVNFMVLKPDRVVTWLSCISATLHWGSVAHTVLFQLKTEVIFSDENTAQYVNPFRIDIETFKQVRRWQSLTIDWNFRFILD